METTDPKAPQAQTPAPAAPAPPSEALVTRASMTPARSLIVRDALQGLVPTTIGEAVEISTILANSKAIPKAFRGQRETVFTVIMAGLELGLTPIRALQNLQSIHGNLGMKADLQLALVRKSGLLTFFDEGYEEHGTTDQDLAGRTKDGERILALVKTLPVGKPYGWTTMQRRGDDFVITKVFSWADADRAFTYEKDEDEPNARSEKKKLADKFNFQSWPQDMYPKRSRVRCIQMAFPDVTAGIPAAEHLEDRAIVEGEVIGGGDDDTPDADQLLYDISQVDADLGNRIAGGFTQLKMAGAKKLAKLVEFRGKPQDLLQWLQNEYARRKTGTTKHQPDVLADRKEPTPPPAEQRKPDPPPPPPKPWKVRNSSQRNAWVESGGQRTVLEPGQEHELDAEPDDYGKGIEIVRAPGLPEADTNGAKSGTNSPKPEPIQGVAETNPPKPETKGRLGSLANMKDLNI